MASSLVAFACFLASILALYWAVTYGRKIVARARFVRELSALRDEVEDRVFSGVLPDVECVEFFFVKTQAVLDHVEIVSMSTFVAHEMVEPPSNRRSSPSFGGLTGPQRKLMHDLERRFQHEVARYVVTGSRLWFIFRIVALLPLSKAHAERDHRPRPEKMAEDFSRTLEKSKVRRDGKLAVGPELLLN